jgi:hypothetical protein
MSLVFSVSGCKLLEKNGDALVYQIGPRWTPVTEGRWSPYTQVLIGGMKLTFDQVEEKSMLAVAAGAGVDYKVTPAIALRLASLEYQRGGLQLSTGMVLRLGTW